MKTTAVRLYGAMDLRLETFELPEITEDEILMRVESDTVCASTYKAVRQGSNHKRVPEDIGEHPVIVGHEMCGTVEKVGENLRNLWKVGQRAVIQPALKLESGYDPGYSYRYIGGNATYVVVPKIVLDRGCLVPFEGDSFFKGSLVESLGCILRAYKGCYHTDYSNYMRTDGAKRGGKLAILGGAGPMGIGAVLLASGYAGVGRVVVTDINEERLNDAKRKFPPSAAKEQGTDLIYLNTSGIEDQVAELKRLSDGGFDDVFVMVASPVIFSMAEQICREDGCINFFAGPAVHDLPGSLNLYRVHYDGIHVVGTAGSIPEDTVEVIRLIEQNKIDPSALISHIMGLKDAPNAIFGMEKPNGIKKVCYPHLDIPMIAVDELAQWGRKDPLYAELAEIVQRRGGNWCAEAESYLLAHAPRIEGDYPEGAK